MNTTRLLVSEIVGYKTKVITKEVRQLACRHMVDTLACIVCGMQENTPQKVLSYLKEKECRHGIGLLGSQSIRVSAEDAALYYGICAHVCDYDDLSKNFGGHPGAVILPVILALGEETNASKDRLLRAYAAGVEVSAILGASIVNHGLNAGWNPTTLLGIFGAAAAGAVLLDLDEEQTCNAMGISAGEASGLKVNYGSAAKDLTVGRTSAKAVFALKMAVLGLDAAKEPLCSEGGLLTILSEKFDEKKLMKELETHESDFLKPGIILKPYPSCRGMHNGIDGMLKIVRTHGIKPDEVKQIICRVQDTVFESNRYMIPKNGVEGKFSLPYCLALCLYHHQVTPDDFTEDSEITEEMIQMMKKVKLVRDTDFTDAKSGIEVCVQLKDQKNFSVRGNYAKGDPRNPISDEEFKEKLHYCFARRVSKEKEQEIIHMWMQSEKIDFEKLHELLGQGNGGYV